MLNEWLEMGKLAKDQGIKIEEIFSMGKKSGVWRTFFRQLTSFNTIEDLKKIISKKLSSGKSCEICGKRGARPLPKYLFPFIIDAERFPNLYPSASSKSKFYVCEECSQNLLYGYSCLFWYIDGKNERFIGILPFSEEKELLSAFIKRVIEDREIIESGGSTNIAFLKGLKDQQTLAFKFSYPYEFGFYLLYYLRKKLQLGEEWYEKEDMLKKFFSSLKLFIIRIDNAFRSRSIFQELSQVFVGSEHWNLLAKIEEIEEGDKNFLLNLYLYTRKYLTFKKEGNPQSDLFIRECFFREVMKRRKIEGELLEELLIYNLTEGGKTSEVEKSRIQKQRVKKQAEVLNWYEPIFSKVIFKFLKEYYNCMGMTSEKEILEIAEKEGWELGKKLLKVEANDKDKVKAYIYELRRARSISDFMEKLNELQLRCEAKISLEFINLTLTHREKFKEWKAYFLIGMANSIVEGEKNEG